MIREVQVGDWTWYVLTRSFRTERGAIAAFNRLDAEGRGQRGKLDLGIYRHGFAKGEITLVSVVSHRRDGMDVADRLLDLGEDVELDHANVRALILRRARVVGNLLDQDAASGSYRIRRGRPASVRADGTFDENIGGDEPREV